MCSFILCPRLKWRFGTAGLSEAAPRLRLGFASLEPAPNRGACLGAHARPAHALGEGGTLKAGSLSIAFFSPSSPLLSSSFPSLFSFSPLPMPHGLPDLTQGKRLPSRVLYVEITIFFVLSLHTLLGMETREPSRRDSNHSSVKVTPSPTHSLSECPTRQGEDQCRHHSTPPEHHRNPRRTSLLRVLTH